MWAYAIRPDMSTPTAAVIDATLTNEIYEGSELCTTDAWAALA